MRLASGINARQNPKNSDYFRAKPGLRNTVAAAKIIGILRILCEYAALTPRAKRKTLCNGGGGGNLSSHRQEHWTPVIADLLPDAHNFPADARKRGIQNGDATDACKAATSGRAGAQSRPLVAALHLHSAGFQNE
jgi:hypothetical protein